MASIVANHGGDVSVESAEGHGTTFTVRLPRLTPRQHIGPEVPAVVAESEQIVADIVTGW